MELLWLRICIISSSVVQSSLKIKFYTYIFNFLSEQLFCIKPETRQLSATSSDS